MKYLFYLGILLIPFLGFSQNTRVIPDDSLNINLIDVGKYYKGKKKIDIYISQDTSLKCKIKPSYIGKNDEFFNKMRVRLNNRYYYIGYHNFLALINRERIPNIGELLRTKKVLIGYRSGELNLIYKTYLISEDIN